jgi:hypothetical protein
MQLRDDISDYIENRVVKSPCIYPSLDPCWLWVGGQYGGLNESGSQLYGGIRPYKNSTKKYRVHRITYQIFCGELNENQMLRHRCDTKSCCNPTHLELGTQRDNMLDYHRRHKPYLQKLSTENSSV